MKETLILFTYVYKNQHFLPNKDVDPTPIEWLIWFLRQEHFDLLTEIQSDLFCAMQIGYCMEISCPGSDNICFIYNAEPFLEYEQNDYYEENYKYLNVENSFRISKKNFIEIATLWKGYDNKKTPCFMLWTDLDGNSHLEFFKKEDVMNKREQDLKTRNIIMSKAMYIKKYDIPEIQRIEPQTFYIKAFKKHWGGNVKNFWGYSSIGITPQHGVGELLRFFHQFAHEEQLLEQDSLFMKSLSTIPQLNVLGLDRIATASADSPICYLYAWQNPSLSQDIFDEQLIPYFTSQNSLKLFKKNLPDIFNTWRQILIDLPDCVLIWQDKQEWIHIESFADEQRMNERIKQL